MRIHRLLYLLVTALPLLSACGAQETPAPTPIPTAIPSPTTRVPVGTDITVDLPEGDLERGADQARSKSCIHCHVDAIATRFESVGDIPKISERGELRISDPAYNGSATSHDEYILESILLPEVFIVPGTPSGAVMPTNFDQLLTRQDLADILAWLDTFE